MKKPRGPAGVEPTFSGTDVFSLDDGPITRQTNVTIRCKYRFIFLYLQDVGRFFKSYFVKYPWLFLRKEFVVVMDHLLYQLSS